MEKECKICGVFFETDNKNKLCCDDCSKHYSSRKYQYSKGLANSIKRMKEPEVVEYDCEQCGTHFKTIEKLVFFVDFESIRHRFCSKKCRNEYKHLHAICNECGVSLADKEYNPDSQFHFCSPECKQIHERKAAIQAGLLRTCLHCGKEFIRKEGTFCSRECYLAAVKEGWQPTGQPEEFITRMEICPVCGKAHEETYRKGVNIMQIPATCCSPECKAKHDAKRIEQQKKLRKKEAEAVSKVTASIEPKTTPGQRKSGENLCASCRVPYKQCERMQSEFRILPEGAHYNENGMIAVCPKYK